LAPGRRILDAGCGTGYGTAELARASSLACTGVDIAPEAIAYAAEHFPLPRFLRASATALPFRDASFDLVISFELIEHLTNWNDLLAEAGRVLAPSGVFIVSTPNRVYYAESRGEHGPNPFHAHEFTFEEFKAALEQTFAHVRIYLQDRMEAMGFVPHCGYSAPTAEIAATAPDPSTANFFVAICSAEPLPEPPALVYVPRAANILRERERHIQLLETELAQKQRWLDETTADRVELMKRHSELQRLYDERGLWAADLENQLKAAQQRVRELDAEVEAAAQTYLKHVTELERENVEKTHWAQDTEARLTEQIRKREEALAEANRLLDTAESTVVERTEWAQRLEREADTLRQHLAMVRQSRWLKLGRAAGLGPRLDAKEPGS
jgi:SAM-dependent methyltransferase